MTPEQQKALALARARIRIQGQEGEESALPAAMTAPDTPSDTQEINTLPATPMREFDPGPTGALTPTPEGLADQEHAFLTKWYPDAEPLQRDFILSDLRGEGVQVGEHSIGGSVSRAANAMKRGIFGSWQDEVAAGIQLPIEAAKGALGMDSLSFDDLQQRELDRVSIQRSHNANPISEIVGMTVAPAGLAGAAARGANALVKGAGVGKDLVRATLAGAAAGGSSGAFFGLGDESGEGRLANAQQDGTNGALLGAVAGPVAERVVSPVLQRVANVLPGSHRTQSVAANMVSDGIGGEIDVTNLPQSPAHLLPDNILMRSGDDVEDIAGSAVRFSPQFKSELTELQSSVAKSQNNRIGKYLEETLGANPNLADGMHREIENMKPGVGAMLYDQGMMTQRANISEKARRSLEGLTSSDLRRVLSTAEKAAKFDAAELGLNFTPGQIANNFQNGTATVGELQQVTRALKSMADQAFQSGRSAEGHIFKRARESLLEGSDALRMANYEYRTLFARQEIIEDGEAFLKGDMRSLDSKIDRLDEMPAEYAKLFKIGVANGIMAKVEKSRDNANSVASFMTDDFRSRIRKIFPGQEAEQFLKALEAEDEAMRKLNRILGGSPTQGRRVADERFSAKTALGMALRPFTEIPRQIENRLVDGWNERSANKVGELLLGDLKSAAQRLSDFDPEQLGRTGLLAPALSGTVAAGWSGEE